MKGERQFGLWMLLALSALLAVACGGTRERDAGPESGPAAEEARMISAAQRGDAGAVKGLLEEGASVDARDGSGRTALVAAAYENRVGVAKVLVEAGAGVNVKDETEQSAYLISTSEVGDDPRLLRLTLRNGANVKSLDSYRGTGLIRAAERGHVRIVSELLETNIEVDHVNELGWTALLEAIILGDGGPRHTEVVRLLVEAGANVNLADGEGVTPLEHARATTKGSSRSWRTPERASEGSG
jgi:ankyrin repeat protein